MDGIKHSFLEAILILVLGFFCLFLVQKWLGSILVLILVFVAVLEDCVQNAIIKIHK